MPIRETVGTTKTTLKYLRLSVLKKNTCSRGSRISKYGSLYSSFYTTVVNKTVLA